MKRPAFQFYPGDWLRDTALRSCSVAARGLWMDLLCFMHDGEPYGHLAVAGQAIPGPKLAHMVGLKYDRFSVLLRELERAKVLTKTDRGTVYSRRMVRDELLREKKAAGGFMSIGHPNTPRPKGTLHGSHQGIDEGSPAGPPPAVAVAVASAESQLHGSASRRAGKHDPTGDGGSTFGSLMSLVRKHLYVPDGKPPADWDETREGSVLKELRKRHTTEDLEQAIEGLALVRDHPGRYADAVDWLRPGEKVTLRALYSARSGVLPVFMIAKQAYWKHANSRPSGTSGPSHISDTEVLRTARAR